MKLRSVCVVLAGLLVMASGLRAEPSADRIMLADAQLRPMFEAEVVLARRLVPTDSSLAPFGHVRFCLTHPASCEPSERGAALPEANAAACPNSGLSTPGEFRGFSRAPKAI